MKAYFADTSYYISLLVPDDVAHDLSQRVSASLQGEIITTDFVILELAAFFAHPPERAAFCEQLEGIRNERGVTILPAERSVLASGWQIYSQHRDKSWSLTDCISFAVMRERHIHEALTTDHHFEQAGFVAMLRELKA